MKISKLSVILVSFVGAWICPCAAEDSDSLRVTLLPETCATLSFPLALGYQLGIPARDNSAFFAECFSSDALQNELERLNKQIEIGLLVSHTINEETGEITIKLSNESEELKGITLRTGHLLRDRTYLIRVQGQKVFGDRSVTLRLKHEQGTEYIFEERQKISRWRKASELEWSVVPRANGFHDCDFLLQPGGTIRLSGFSMLPNDSLSIWRRESIDVLRSAGVSTLRWPVVDGMNFYNWYDGIGAHAHRIPVQPELTGLKQHDFGTVEYVDFCRTIGVEPFICMTLFTHQCTDSRVRNLSSAAQIAADWVSFCNASKRSNPLVILREKNNIKKPLNVKYWDLTAPPVSALITTEMIATAALRTINAMKEQDADITVGVTLSDDHPQTLEELLRLSGAHLDFITCNAPNAAEIVAEYNRENKTKIMFAATMLRGDCGRYATQWLAGLDESSAAKRASLVNWYDSLGLAHAAVQRLKTLHDGPVSLPYYAEQVLGLVHGSTRLSTDIGLLSAMIGRFPAIEPLAYERSGSQTAITPSVYAAYTADTSMLVVFVYNPAEFAQEMTLDLSRMSRKFSFCIMDQLSADLDSLQNSDEVQVLRTQKAGAVSDTRTFTCEMGAASFARVLIKE